MVHNDAAGEQSFKDNSGVSDQAVDIFIFVVITGLCQTIGVFGIVTNIINVACFVKMGFREAVNISLLGLSLSDVGCLITQIWMTIMYTLLAGGADPPFDPLDFVYLVGVMPHLAFNRVASWITAIITTERCLCITVPLKVNNIITTKRAWILISCVYVIFLLSGTPVFAVNRIEWKFLSSRNKSQLAMVSTVYREHVESITFAVNSFIFPFIALIITITCTVVLVVNLRKRTKWRKTPPNQTDVSRRDQKVAKMIVMISVLFICCLVPICVTMLAMGFEPRLNIGGDLINIGKLLANYDLLMECVNSSVNIFIYYHMSKKYRNTFHRIFSRKKLN